jgi:hypothetical protein
MPKQSFEKRNGLPLRPTYATSIQVDREHWDMLKAHLRHSRVFPGDLVRTLVYRWLRANGLIEEKPIYESFEPDGCFDIERQIKEARELSVALGRNDAGTNSEEVD